MYGLNPSIAADRLLQQRASARGTYDSAKLAVYVSQPDAVAAVIKQAAGELSTSKASTGSLT